MLAREFWKTVVKDSVDMLDALIELFDEHRILYCVIGGQAVNAYAEPLVSLDLDLAVATEQLDLVESLLSKKFRIEEFEHSINVSVYGSDLRVQIQTDPRYSDFPTRAEFHDVLGVRLPVACMNDLLQGKVWAVLDPTRRSSKRQKDLADIARLIEAHPELRQRLPGEVQEKLV